MHKFHKTAFYLLFAIVFAFLAAACTESKKETLSPEEVQQLQEAHPQFFGLDTSDGLPDENSCDVKTASGRERISKTWQLCLKLPGFAAFPSYFPRFFDFCTAASTASITA